MTRGRKLKCRAAWGSRGSVLSALVLLCLPRRAPAQLPQALLEFRKYEVRDAEARGALCLDGSPAVYYFRDCPRPAKECSANAAGAQWLVVFQSAATTSGACWDAQSCSMLPSARTSSLAQPNFLSAAELATGIFSDSGEGNPNFYERRAVWVPSCDGSIWLGNSSNTNGERSPRFRGRAIMQAVWEDLQDTVYSPVSVPTPYGPGPNNTRISDASQVAVIGSAGVILWLDALASSLSSQSKSTSVVGICDGCLILDIPPLADRPCTSATFPWCSPKAFLSKASSAWELSVPSGRTVSSLFAGELLPSITSSLLVQHPQYDREQLRALGVASWPPHGRSAGVVYARKFARTVRSHMRSRPDGGLYTFSIGCSGYSSMSGRSSNSLSHQKVSASALLNDDAFNCRPVQNCTLAGENGTVSELALTAATSMFLTAGGADPFRPTCVDTCVDPDCSAWCGSKVDCGIRL